MRYTTTLTLSALWLLPMQPQACTDTILSADHITVAAPFYPTFSEPEGRGVFFEIVKEVFEAEGYKIITCILPIRRSIRDLQRGKIDMYLTDWEKSYLTEATLYQPEKLHTPNIPISTELVSAASTANSAFYHQLQISHAIPQALLDNKQHLIAWNKGFDYQYLFDLEASSYQVVDSVKQGLHMLKGGRIELYLNDDDNISIALKKLTDLETADFHITPLLKQQLYPVFQNTERGHQLAELYDRKMEVLLAQKRILELYRQAGYDYQPELPKSR